MWWKNRSLCNTRIPIKSQVFIPCLNKFSISLSSIGISLTVKTVLLGGTVVEVGCLFLQICVHQVTIVLAEQKIPYSMSALVDTNVQKAVQILYPVMQGITKMRQHRRPAESARLASIVTIHMDQSSPMDSTSA